MTTAHTISVIPITILEIVKKCFRSVESKFLAMRNQRNTNNFMQILYIRKWFISRIKSWKIDFSARSLHSKNLLVNEYCLTQFGFVITNTQWTHSPINVSICLNDSHLHQRVQVIKPVEIVLHHIMYFWWKDGRDFHCSRHQEHEANKHTNHCVQHLEILWPSVCYNRKK